MISPELMLGPKICKVYFLRVGKYDRMAKKFFHSYKYVLLSFKAKIGRVADLLLDVFERFVGFLEIFSTKSVLSCNFLFPPTDFTD